MYKLKIKKGIFIIFTSVFLLIGAILRFHIAAHDPIPVIDNSDVPASSDVHSDKSTDEIKNTGTEVTTTNPETTSSYKDETNLPSKIPAVRPDKTGFDFSYWNDTCDPILVVINKDNTMPKYYNPKIVGFKDMKINKIIIDDLNNMINDAATEGINLYVSSGYRSMERQTMLFNRQISRCKAQGYKEGNAETVAATVVAKPGTSEHHTGLAIDFNGVRDDFYTTKEYNWLIQNGPNYGFILRYPQDKKHITNVIYEPWHFRYVGKEHAKQISKSGLCLEEYIETIIKKAG